MKLDALILKDVSEVVSERFAAQSIENIEIKSIEIDEVNFEIRIVVSILASAEPKTVAEGYFGLTNMVRKALGNEWREFFPVITPEISSSAHA